jgi:protein gp37
MAKDSKIEWTHHTFNPWWGCTKVSAACKHCYAEAWAKRVGSAVWGAKAPRRFFSDAHWRQPLAWDQEARAAGSRRRVFCASMADVFEPRADLEPWRNRLWALIEATPSLDWLVLTKRPERAAMVAPWAGQWPRNVWLGATVESQRWAERRISALAECGAHVRFLSCEPLLAPLDLRPWLGDVVHWVIAGGESGPRPRPSHPRWIRDLRDQCVAVRVPFLFKQWGSWTPLNGHRLDRASRAIRLSSGETMIRLNKTAAGRVLDGEVWDGVP